MCSIVGVWYQCLQHVLPSQGATYGYPLHEDQGQSRKVEMFNGRHQVRGAGSGSLGIFSTLISSEAQEWLFLAF